MTWVNSNSCYISIKGETMKKTKFEVRLYCTLMPDTDRGCFITYSINAIDQRTAVNLAISKLLKNENPYEYRWLSCKPYPYSEARIEPYLELAHGG